MEDDADIRSAVTDLLEDKGFTVLNSVDYDSAVIQLRSSPSIDLLICDSNLIPNRAKPDESGQDFADVVREQHAELPIVVYSGADDITRYPKDDPYTQVYSKSDARTFAQEGLDDLLDSAIRYSQLKAKNLNDSAKRTRSKFVTPSHFSLARDAKTTSEPNDFPTWAHRVSDEDKLAENNYYIRVIDKSVYVTSGTKDLDTSSLKGTLVIWVQPLENGRFSVEVFAYPEFAASGDDLKDAVANLLSMMNDHRQELRGRRLDGRKSELRIFLREILK